MRPQLPEHAVVALVKQCFVIPSCMASQICRQSVPGSLWRLHTERDSQRRQVELSRFGRHQRLYQTSSRQEPHFQSSFSAIGSLETSAQLLHSKKRQEGGTDIISTEPNIAVLGGGITGLASAHYLAKEIPHANITIYEGSNRLGGWVKSNQVDVGNGRVIFEQGPRTLRPNTPAGLVTLDLIKDLSLESELLITPRDSIAAQNRYIYYPDHVVKLPGPGQDVFNMLWAVFTEPAFSGWFGALMEGAKEPRNSEVSDESVGSFLSRRLGSSQLVDNIASAGMHGIYAGDIYKLSARSLMPVLWGQETAHGSLTRYFLESMQNGQKTMLLADSLLRNEMTVKLGQSSGDNMISLLERMGSASVYTFKSGIGTLTEALATHLKVNPRVQFKMGSNIEAVIEDRYRVDISTTAHGTTSYDHVISTIPAAKLADTTPHLPTLSEINSVTVMVVNLFYSTPDLMPEPGFGYLIPRSVPFDQNPECALGVVFDTYSSIGQDASGTKITVMLGGHWWDTFDEYPNEGEGAAMAKAILKRHLGRSFEEEPEKVLVGLHRDCIPQYEVGHEARLQEAHQDLMAHFKGRLSVAGSSYGGVGLNDCVRGARDAVLALKDGENGLKPNTGLEKFIGPKAWAHVMSPARETAQKKSKAQNEFMERRIEKLKRNLEERQKEFEDKEKRNKK